MNRVGVVTFPMAEVMNRTPLVVTFFKEAQFIPFKLVYDPYMDTMEYTGSSPLFDPVPAGERPPHYVLKVDEVGIFRGVEQL